MNYEALKAYCHTDETYESLSPPIKCSEITLQASPDMIRMVANFLLDCAKKCEDNNAISKDHFHLRDESRDWNSDFIDVVVFPVK